MSNDAPRRNLGPAESWGYWAQNEILRLRNSVSMLTGQVNRINASIQKTQGRKIFYFSDDSYYAPAGTVKAVFMADHIPIVSSNPDVTGILTVNGFMQHSDTTKWTHFTEVWIRITAMNNGSTRSISDIHVPVLHRFDRSNPSWDLALSQLVTFNGADNVEINGVISNGSQSGSTMIVRNISVSLDITL